MDYSTMSNEELELENQKLMAEKAAILDKQRALTAVLNDRAFALRRDALANELAGLTEAQRTQVIQATSLTLAG